MGSQSRSHQTKWTKREDNDLKALERAQSGGRGGGSGKHRAGRAPGEQGKQSLRGGPPRPADSLPNPGVHAAQLTRQLKRDRNKPQHHSEDEKRTSGAGQRLGLRALTAGPGFNPWSGN